MPTTQTLTPAQELQRRDFLLSSPEVLAAGAAGVSVSKMLKVLAAADRRFLSTLV